MRTYLLVVTLSAAILGGFAGVEAVAQARCSAETDSIAACWERYIPDNYVALNTEQVTAQKEERQGLAQKEVINELLDLVTSSNIVGGDTASTVNNFLPLLAFTGFGGDISGNANSSSSSDKDIAFDVNLPFFGSGGENAIRLQAAFARDRQIYDPLLSVIPEADRDRVKTEFNNKSNIGDDARFSVSYNMVTDTFGRSFRQHRARFEDLYLQATAPVSPPSNIERFVAIRDLVNNQIGNGVNPPGQSLAVKDWPKTADFDSLSAEVKAKLPSVRVQIIALTEQAARLTFATQAAENQQLAKYRVLDFRDLVDNQPQLMFNITTRERDELVGPDEQMASLTFEFPLGANLWNFNRKHGSGSCNNWRSETCLEAFGKYIGSQSRISMMAPRFSLSVEYVNIDDYNVNLTDPMVMFSQSGTRKLVASAAFGMRFNGEGAMKDTRFDLAIKHEDLSDDPMRNNRTVASATWTKQFTGMSLPVTLIYSNQSEFIDQQNLGERFSANVGLKYEFRQHEQ